jgi:hypothetical protein
VPERSFAFLTLKAIRIRVIGVALQKLNLRHILVRTFTHRNVVEPTDAFLVCYPKSGSTWLTFLLYEILTGQPTGFDTTRRAMPYIARGHNAARLLPNNGRMFKSHEPYHVTYHNLYRKVIYLVRDVRDVVISEHKHWQGDGMYSGDLDHYLVDFVTGRVHGLGTWVDHVHSWLNSDLAKHGDLLLVRYEDLRRDTEGTLQDILCFLDVQVEPETIRTAIENNTVAKMREKENEVIESGTFRAVKPDFRRVNRGVAGGWKDTLSHDQVALIERYAGKTLAMLGYEVAEP